eukprot:TRINITY_DN440_c0_g1_i3.p2 TRINITY_DN440_c0_g1~~TRINITY_DN440_c0_g1_i3.p2  ORF type:complete len:101 (-),score=7.15 TRINITY_DN440_c0_g1_i3:297-599(-)
MTPDQPAQTYLLGACPSAQIGRDDSVYRVPDLKLDLLLVDGDHACAKLDTDGQICNRMVRLLCMHLGSASESVVVHQVLRAEIGCASGSPWMGWNRRSVN